MFDFLGPRIHIGCSTTALALLRRDRFGHHTGVPIERCWPGGTDPLDGLVQQLRSALDEARCAGARVTIVLSDDWFFLAVVAPPPALMRTRARLSAVMPVALQSVLQDIVAQYRLRGVVLQSHFTAAWLRWQGALDNTDWFGLLHDGRLILLSRHGGKMIALVQQSLAEDDMTDPGWPGQLVRTEAARLGLPVPPRIVLCGEVPQPWLVAAAGRLPCHWLHDKKLPAGSLSVALAQAGIPA